MKCPKCRAGSLKQTAFNSPYFCKTCGGMWYLNTSRIDCGELSTGDIDREGVSDAHDCKTGMCPSGHGIMIRAKIDIDEPFYLEKCTACGGIWFDKGEWQRIAENNMADNLSVIWSSAWQRKQSKEKNRESFLQANQKLLGESLFTRILELAEKLKEHPEKDRAIALLRQESA